jgi:hypothetical protein
LRDRILLDAFHESPMGKRKPAGRLLVQRHADMILTTMIRALRSSFIECVTNHPDTEQTQNDYCRKLFYVNKVSPRTLC